MRTFNNKAFDKWVYDTCKESISDIPISVLMMAKDNISISNEIVSKICHKTGFTEFAAANFLTDYINEK